MLRCPSCQSTPRQVQHERNPSGSQRYLWQTCPRTYSPEPMPTGYDTATRQQALRLYFVHACQRHLHTRAFPRYACHLSDFVCP